MRIGFFADEYLPRLDGVIVSMLNSARGLRELGHEVYFIVPKYPGNGNDEFVIKVPSSAAPLSDNVRIMRPSRRIKQQISRLGLDIIHSHTPLTAGFLARKTAEELDVPHVATFHTLLPVLVDYYPIRSKTYFVPSVTAIVSDILWSTNLTKYKPPASSGRSNTKRWAWRLTGAYADSVDLVTSPSEYYTQELKQLGLTTPVVTVSNGLDLREFVPIDVEPKRTLHIVAVGRLSEEKRQGALLEAASHLSSDNFKITIVGGGPIEEKLKDKARALKLKNVAFTGELKPDEVRQLLKTADVGALASHGFDTQCIALIEYMATGLPVLYCDPHLQEVVGAQAGLLVGPEPSSLAAGMSRLAEDVDLRKRMSRAALEKSRTYSYQEAAKRLEQLYQNQLGLG